MNIIELYQDLRKYITDATQYDDMFYDAPEGDAQIDIIKEMLREIASRIK